MTDEIKNLEYALAKIGLGEYFSDQVGYDEALKVVSDAARAHLSTLRDGGAVDVLMPTDVQALICEWTKNDVEAVNQFIGACELCGYRMTKTAAASPAPADAWLDIASAPRDGSWFVVHVPESPMCWQPYELASWIGPSENRFYGCDGQFHDNTDGYYCGTDTSDEISFDGWFPLPAPKGR